MSSNSSAARILMASAGETCKVTGFAVSGTSTLYATKYLATAGTSLIEYLPYVFSSTVKKGFRAHMIEKNEASIFALGATAIILAGGIILRKFGSILSNDNNIRRVERFLYGYSDTKSSSD